MHLQARLENALRVSSDSARVILYRVVHQLNASFFPPVTSLELVLTEGCNLACTYCFEKEMLGYKRMPLDTARAAVDLLFDYSRNEPRISITHFGGEPTLNFPAIQHVTDYATQRASVLGKSVEFNTTTNGVMLDESMVNYFAEHKIDVLLSIDGLESSHNRYRCDKRGQGTFERVVKGLRILKQAQPWVSAKMTVMPANAPNLFEDVVGLHGLGINQFIIGYATGITWSTD